MLGLCSSSVDILRNLAAMSSKVSVCTKHTPAPKLQALSKTCPLIAAPKFCGCMCLSMGCRTAGKWRQKPGIRCQWFECGRKTVILAWQEAHVQEERELKKGIQGRSLVTYCLIGWWKDWKQDEEQGDEKLGLDLRWIKSELHVRNPERKAWWWREEYWDQG